MTTSLYFATQAGFVVLTIVYLVLFMLQIRKGVRGTTWDEVRKTKFINRIITALVLWALFVSAWSVSGKMSDFSIFPLNFMPVILIPLIMAIVFISSSALGEVLRHIQPASLIRLQSFRFFVEILLWMLFINNLLPVQMTFEGRNFDILAGLSAPVIAWLVSTGRISRRGVIVWNILCLGLLLNIVITAILSTPSPWRVFMNEPANYIVAWFPISWLPGLLVPLAYYLHFISLKQQLQRKRVGSPATPTAS